MYTEQIKVKKKCSVENKILLKFKNEKIMQGSMKFLNN